MKDEELLAWFLLLRAPHVGPVTLNALLAVCPDPTQLIRHPPSTVPERLRRYLQKPEWSQAEADLEWLHRSKTHLLPITQQEDYPTLLKQLKDAPTALFYKGNIDLLHMPQLAVIGSRHASRSGLDTGYQFCRYLAQHGIAITSGLAQGVDAIAHQGALSANGNTIAVMGTGLDRVYPAHHRDLAHKIAEKGLLITEYLPGTRPHKGNFPRRNRIIAGLSMGVLVVEAAFKSGSLITAKIATELGREVFAIPGSIHSPMARGCHRLIREGAKLVETAEHIIEELLPAFTGFQQAGADISVNTTVEKEQPLPEIAVDEHQILLEKMGFEPVTPDQLVECTQFTAAEVSSMLLLLELQGYVTQVTGGMFLRSRQNLKH